MLIPHCRVLVALHRQVAMAFSMSVSVLLTRIFPLPPVRAEEVVEYEYALRAFNVEDHETYGLLPRTDTAGKQLRIFIAVQ